MNALSLLFRNTLRKDKLRLLCAWVGITAAVALLTWAIGLAVSSWNQCRPLSERLGKPFDCWVATNRASGAAPKGTGMQRLTHASPFKMMPKAVIEAVKTSEDVESAICTTVFRCRIDWRPEGRPLQGPGVGGGVAPVRDFPECPYPDGLLAGRWPTATSETPEFVISPNAFGGVEEAPPVGTKVEVVTLTGNLPAVICGYLHPSIRTVAGFPSMFASDNLAAATALAETEDSANIILIKLKEGRSSDRLEALVRTVSPDDDAAMLVSRAALLKQLRSDALNSLLRQLPLLVSLAIVATICMIVNALCIGIEQNRLRYARLRAIGMSAWQLVRLVLREAVALGLGGTVAGILIGGGCLALFILTHPLVFPDGIMVGGGTIVLILSLVALATLIACIHPMRQALKCKPFEHRMLVAQLAPKVHYGRLVFALGMTLPVVLTPYAFRDAPLPCSLWFIGVGLPLAIWGIIRLARELLPLLEGLLARPLGFLLQLRPELLRHTLSRDCRRNTRMVLTLTTGLGTFFAIHIWGASLTDPFIPTKKLPQAIVTLSPNGVSHELAKDLVGKKGEIPALGPLTYRPFSANQYPLMEEDFQAIVNRTGRTPKQNNILLIATQGLGSALNPHEAEGVTITEMFARQTGLSVGDTFHIQRKDRKNQRYTLPLTITRIVRCNWHLVSARAGLRGRNGAPFHTMGPVFVPWHLAEKWDPEAHERVCFMWLDGLASTSSAAEALYAATERIETHFRALVEHDPKPYVNVGWRDAPGRRKVPEQAEKPKAVNKVVVPNVTVRLRDEISEGTLAHSAELLGDLARIPLWSLLILSTGFISLLAANVRTLAGELRTLHAIGMTRFQLGRYLFSQAITLSCASALLALLLGSTIGWGFTGWTLANMPFGGLPTVFILPFSRLIEGFGVLLLFIFIITPLPITVLIRKILAR